LLEQEAMVGCDQQGRNIEMHQDFAAKFSQLFNGMFYRHKGF
jgi:hypothetical protein